MDPKIVSIAATMTQIPFKSRTSIYALVERGELEAVRVGGRRFITQRSIDHFIDRLHAQADSGVDQRT